MQCLCAIDIRGGRCVRLLQGSFAEETVYGDPLEQARAYVEQGAGALHVVDLDAARGGADNAALIDELLAVVRVPVQVSGGVRDERRAEQLLARGAARVVLGTLAAEEPDRVRRLAESHPGKIAVGLDYRPVESPSGARRELALRGWAEGSPTPLEQLLGTYGASPLGAVVVTDISRDGTLVGPDVEGYRELLGETALPLYASGGVSSAADLAALAGLEVAGRRLAGTLVGRALLSGAVSVHEAVLACGQ